LQAPEDTVLILCLSNVSHTYGTLEKKMWLDASPGRAVHLKPASRGNRFIPRTLKGQGSHADSCLSPFHSSNS